MQIKGKIKSVIASYSRTEPLSPLDLGQNDTGRIMELNLGFSNTGNVNQTVTFNSLSNFIKCSQVGTGKFVMQGGIDSPNANVAILEPNKACDYFFTIKLDSIPVGAPLTDFSLDADWTWS
jgi:hypothetical protein